jgi:FkbM family methyltransferase
MKIENFLGAFKSRIINFLGKLRIPVQSSLLSGVLIRQSNTPLSVLAFNEIVLILGKYRNTKQSTKVLIPDDMQKAFHFIKPHFNSVKFVNLSNFNSMTDLNILFLKTQFLYCLSDYLHENKNHFSISYISDEWVILTRDDKSHLLAKETDLLNKIALEAKKEIVNGIDESKFYVRPGTNDFQIVQEVEASYFPLIKKHFGPTYLSKTKQKFNILDLGGHIGSFSIQCSHFFSHNCNVHIYEPEPGNYQQIKKNIKLNNSRNVKAYNEALSSQKGEGFLYFNPEHRGASQLNRGLSYKTEKIPVIINALKNAISRFKDEKIDLLKIDIEGSEYDVLMGASEELKNISMIIGEAQKTDKNRPKDLINFLKSQDYSVEVHGIDDLIVFSAIKKDLLNQNHCIN